LQCISKQYDFAIVLITMFRFLVMTFPVALASKWQVREHLSSGESVKLFDEWQAQFGVVDANYAVWSQTVQEVVSHNKLGASWTAGLNEFSHLTWEQFKEHFNLAPQNCSATQPRSSTLPAGRVALTPTTRDWRNDIPIHVKSQGHCGSCWTFSTTGATEAHNFLATGKDVLLAEQQLVDCAGAFDNHGCNGGLPSHAFEYLHYFGGQMTETDYPYTAEDGSCKADASKVAAVVESQVNITFQDEDQLLDAVGQHGPVSVAYQVASDFRNYAGGVYSSTVCKSRPEDVNHAVLAVGFDHDQDSGKDYWIVKNSWGTSFGLDGYFLMERGVNMCGVSDCASFPVMKASATLV